MAMVMAQDRTDRNMQASYLCNTGSDRGRVSLRPVKGAVQVEGLFLTLLTFLTMMFLIALKFYFS